MSGESLPSKDSGWWAVFNSGGACVIENVSREVAADYMTADRFERGWTMVSVVVFKSMADLASPPPQATGALVDVERIMALAEDLEAQAVYATRSGNLDRVRAAREALRASLASPEGSQHD